MSLDPRIWRFSHPRSSPSTPSASCVTWDEWPHLFGLCLEAVVRFSQTGEVLSDWETTSGVLVFLVEGQSVQDCTSRREGPEEGLWVAVITGRAGRLFLPRAGVLVQGHQASDPMASRARGSHHLTHSEDIAKPCVRTQD